MSMKRKLDESQPWVSLWQTLSESEFDKRLGDHFNLGAYKEMSKGRSYRRRCKNKSKQKCNMVVIVECDASGAVVAVYTLNEHKHNTPRAERLVDPAVIALVKEEVDRNQERTTAPALLQRLMRLDKNHPDRKTLEMHGSEVVMQQVHYQKAKLRGAESDSVGNLHTALRGEQENGILCLTHTDKIFSNIDSNIMVQHLDRVTLTHPKLLLFFRDYVRQDHAVLHIQIDGTYKLNNKKYPVLVIGFADGIHQFHPLSVSIVGTAKTRSQSRRVCKS
jgi:hypothetical protein